MMTILCYESGVATNGVVGLYNPHEPQLNAMQFMQAYAHAANMLGAIFYPGEEVIAVERRGDKSEVCSYRARTKLFLQSCDFSNWSVVGCLWGVAWNTNSCPSITRAKYCRSVNHLIPLQHILFGEGIYLAPKSDELLVVGTVRDDAGFGD